MYFPESTLRPTLQCLYLKVISLLTLTQPHRARLLEECVESAGAELQLIVQSASPEEYGRDRVRQIRMAETEYVAVHVPRVLYNWRKNDGVSAANSRWWAQNMPAVSEQIIKRWSIRPGEVAVARIDRK